MCHDFECISLFITVFAIHDWNIHHFKYICLCYKPHNPNGNGLEIFTCNQIHKSLHLGLDFGAVFDCAVQIWILRQKSAENHRFRVSIQSRFVLSVFVKMSLLWWCQNLLQELLDLVNVCLHLTVEGQERRMSSWSQIVQISWFPAKKNKYI